jgi:hypothetical protein
MIIARITVMSAVDSRIIQLAQQIACLEEEKEDALAQRDFQRAANLAQQIQQCRRELHDLDLPDTVARNRCTSGGLGR